MKHQSWMILPVAVAAVAALTVAIVAIGNNGSSSSSTKTTSATQSMPGMNMGGSTGKAGLQSYAGQLPANADALAKARKPYDATLPALHPGPVVPLHITLKDVTVQIAPGVKFTAWTFDGGAPGPVIHVRQGQTIKVTLTNGGAIPHSIDFHAARIAPDKAFASVMPGKSFSFSFKAGDPGVFMYHCGTPPVLAHIANGMYGAIVVDPATPLRHADKEYVLVAGEWYLDGPGITKAAYLDMDKARAMMPDWVTFNGYANQYKDHPLTAKPGDLVRFYVVDAGPSLTTAFHVVGTIFDRAYVNGDMTQFQRGVQTVDVPAGGGGVFETRITEPGLYPFVSHSFASVDMGEVGILKVGNVQGTMSH
jgi:nitrite reductase (NO-forming)